MRDLMIVASFTIKDMLQRKSFIISMIIILLLIVIGFNVPNVISSLQGEETEVGTKLLIVDENNVFEGILETLNTMELGYDFEIMTTSISEEQVKEKIENEEVEYVVKIKDVKARITLEYITASVGTFSYVPTELVDVLSNMYTSIQISKLGLSQTQIAGLYAEFNTEVTQLDENAATGNTVVIMLISIVLFYAIYFCAYQVSSSITTEKTSRIMETLITSTKPRTIVLGKTLGIGIVGIIQITLMILVAVISAKLFVSEELLSGLLDMSNITPFLAIITILYFILGYALYALLYALTGSTVSKPEDINSANSPIAMIAVVGFYLSYFSMMNPNSDINVWASIIPISAPFSMPFRVMMGTVTNAQLAISLVVMVISILIIASISIKIYSSAVLNYGSKLSLKDMFKIYKDKNN